jgi:hypothetical protein
MGDRVRLLLDVDGVLNVAGTPCSDWKEWLAVRCRGSTINHSPEVGRAIADLGVEIIWLTTWREEANQWIGPLFGWPEHPVIAIGDEEMLSWRSWWKLDAAKRLYADSPVPFIWADDELSDMGEAHDWCREVDGLPIVPRANVGLTRRHLEEMRRYVERRSRK